MVSSPVVSKSVDAEQKIKGSGMISLTELKAIVAGVLQIGERMDSLEAESPLLGGVPEFDSMAVVSILTVIEEEFDLEIQDDEVSAEVFETLNALLEFLNKKLG